MNGRIARKLRKINEFDPHAKRYYYCLNNANNFVIGNNGEPERCGGTWLEVTDKGDLVTNRSRYKYMKEAYYGRTF